MSATENICEVRRQREWIIVRRQGIGRECPGAIEATRKFAKTKLDCSLCRVLGDEERLSLPIESGFCNAVRNGGSKY
ncbi:MAG: hypothetical protein MK080_13370 [Opitutales bacterium]|nr:hypothetical protein [Opitutales bacterium]